MRATKVFHWCSAGLLLALAACGSDDGGASPAVTASSLEPWIVYEGPVRNGVGNKLVRPDGSGDHPATPNVPVRKDYWQVHPDWSPDGTQLVYAVDDADDEGQPDILVTRDLWISGMDGSNAERVLNCVLPCVQTDGPAWSPDGKMIAFVAFDDDDGNNANARIELMDVATKKRTIVAGASGAGELFYWPRWSPDGTHLAMEIQRWSNSGPTGELLASAIAVVDLEVEQPEPQMITDWDMFATYPDWHPTEDLIVFSTRPWSELESGPSNLHTIRPDGSEQTALTSFEQGETRAVQPSWTPDGSKIIFTAVEGSGFGNPTMAIIDRDGSGLTSATSSGPMFGTHPGLRPNPSSGEEG